jgi:probable biosynthetic protein (TIGR04098 family)
VNAAAFGIRALWDDDGRRRARPLPAAPRRIRIGMPHLDAGGLSEGWLMRHAGDLHWEAIARRLGVDSDELRGPDGERLYPTVVALRARYGRPLADVCENDIFEAQVDVAPCGRACAHGRLAGRAGEASLTVELLTTFAVRQSDGGLRMAVPSAELAARWAAPAARPPAIARLARAARRGEPLDDDFSGPALAAASHAPLGRWTYEPSPYVDYNGAGLLYFAAYLGIADTAERALVRRLGLSPRPSEDWARATSVVRRDVFYYGNLPLGEELAAELLACDRVGAARIKTHVRLRRWDGAAAGAVMADLVTDRRLG